MVSTVRLYCRVGHKKAENIESLFQLYDALEASCQNTLKAGRTGDQKDSATAAQLLEELRIRFVRLVSCPGWAMIMAGPSCDLSLSKASAVRRALIPRSMMSAPYQKTASRIRSHYTDCMPLFPGLVQAVGETWEKFPELKFLALKRMYRYMVRPVRSHPSSGLLLVKPTQDAAER